jgi:uncharacterized surface protein with fasciclin (FAS1) repeats
MADTVTNKKRREYMPTIMEAIRGNAQLHILLESLEKAGLVATLEGEGPCTLFAPDDSAFARMDIGGQLKDIPYLTETMKYHLVAGKLTSEQILSSDYLSTENGKSLTVVLDEGEAVIDNAKIVTGDIVCSNGIIHIIDNVFQPRLSGWYREDLS